MDKVGKPRGLIGYTSQARLDGRARKFLRPRVVVYASLFVALWGVAAFMVTHRQELIIRMLRPPGTSFTLTEGAQITNHFQAKAINKTAAEMVLQPRVPEGYELVAAFSPWRIPPRDTAENQLFIRRDRADFAAGGKEQVMVTFYNGEQAVYRARVTLMGPGKQEGGSP